MQSTTTVDGSAIDNGSDDNNGTTRPTETRQELEAIARAHGHRPGAAQFERHAGHNAIRCDNGCGRLVIVEMALTGRVLRAGVHLDDCDAPGRARQESVEAAP